MRKWLRSAWIESRNFARRLRRWLLDGWPLWMSLMGISFLVLVAANSPAPASALRSGGVVLQALGLALIHGSLSMPNETVEQRLERLEKWPSQFAVAMQREHEKLRNEVRAVERTIKQS